MFNILVSLGHTNYMSLQCYSVGHLFRYRVIILQVNFWAHWCICQFLAWIYDLCHGRSGALALATIYAQPFLLLHPFEIGGFKLWFTIPTLIPPLMPCWYPSSMCAGLTCANIIMDPWQFSHFPFVFGMLQHSHYTITVLLCEFAVCFDHKNEITLWDVLMGPVPNQYLCHCMSVASVWLLYCTLHVTFTVSDTC